jgi:hypothetical protein
MRLFFRIVIVLFILYSVSCANKVEEIVKIPVILDTDANNELDDQHALAYLLCNQDVFNIIGITVNTTFNGGLIESHYEEAMRILTLFNEQENLSVKKGADQSFEKIEMNLMSANFDGKEAVDFIIEKARQVNEDKLVLLPIGKLTNIALALKKEPEIKEKIRIVWLGSNYPEPGEYNLDNDTAALNYILKLDVPFEIVTVSYGRESGTSAILVSVPEIESIMPGKGPEIEGSIIGRHGGEYKNFGDYSINLFEHIDTQGDPPSRSLFDLGAVAIVKNPGWAESRIIPAPKYDSMGWTDMPDNKREIIVWENFDRDSIIQDLYKVLGD